MMSVFPGIYIHLPFCDVHCTYCDFPLTTRISLSGRYYAALFRELDLHPAGESADSLYFGGGTPSLTPPAVLSKIRSRFSLTDEAEITLEANPDHVDAVRLEQWKDLGITRISIGVQSMEDAALKLMLRRHNAAQSLQALTLVRHAGFANVNADLILGTPGQTMHGFLDGLLRLIEMKPTHFSLYLLELHENTALARQVQTGKALVMEEGEQLQAYTSAVRLLQNAGYEHYEVSNFALPGFASRHNLKYWTNAPYFAYGAGACSYLESVRTKNTPSVSMYIEALEKGESPTESRITEDRDTTMRNAVIFGLRKTRGIDMAEFERTFGTSPLSLFEEPPETLIRSGLLEISQNYLRLTFSGMLVSNEVLLNLI